MERYEMFAILFAMMVAADFIAVCIVSAIRKYRKGKLPNGNSYGWGRGSIN